jgi:hypothetical protein
MMNESDSELIRNVALAIEKKDINDIHARLVELKVGLETGDADAIAYTGAPVNISAMHTALREEIGVNQRLMQLRARIPNPVRRSIAFVQAMINGVAHLLPK